mmetsp:Transcript_10900/g.15072  ORF Transcript_10900/g.15072 Transcript_10900/m.15072 type:complete len:1088 (+) Transcript_10900:43-3306(+)
MGLSSSKEQSENDDYKPPLVRQRERLLERRTTVLTDSDAAAFDPTADKYDYLIVFKNDKPKKKISHYDDEGQEQHKEEEKIKWEWLENVWLEAIPGEEDKKEKGRDYLKFLWQQRFGSLPNEDSEEIDMQPKSEIELLVRDHIIDVLSRKSGLQLKLSLSANGRKQYCQVRAPMSLLERKATQLEYKLKFKPEIDPGPAFWQRTDGTYDRAGRPRYIELIEEQRLTSKDETNEALAILYKLGKIGPHDMSVFDEEETTEKHWSRRLRTLERIVDKVPCTNEYPAYASFTGKPKERHLYDEYPSVRGKTLFLSKDRLYLTRRIIDEVFDFGVLEENKLVDLITALHDANYGEMPTADWFLKRWVYFYQAEADRVGAPYVTHYAIIKHRTCPRYLRPFAQPLMEIRSYFGEKIAFYFAWLGFYGYYLIYPALGGLICTLYLLFSGTSDEAIGIHPEQIIMALALVVWSAFYKESWDIESQYCALKWGTLNFEEQEVDRPQFHGDPDGEPRRISPVTNQKETFYPPEKRQQTQRNSLFIIIFFIIALILVIVLIFEIEYLMYLQGGFLASATGAVGVLQAVLIQILSEQYGNFANARNDKENYRTQTEYENALVLKKFLFEIFNNYSALAITAYFKGVYFICTSGTYKQNCLGDLKLLLISIFGTRFALAIYSAYEERVNRIIELVFGPTKNKDDDADSDDDSDDENDDLEGGGINKKKSSANAISETQRFETELELKAYEGTFDDYAEIVLQMGLVSMFTLGWYLVPTLGVLEVLLQIRVDAYKLAAQTRRPDPAPAESVGSWGVLMESMGVLAVYANAGIVVFTTRSFSNYSFLEKLLIFFVLEQIALVLKIVTHASIIDVPTDLSDKKRRNDHVVKRHKVVAFDDDDVVMAGQDDDDTDEIPSSMTQRRNIGIGDDYDLQKKREADKKRAAEHAQKISDLALQRGAVDADLLDVNALKPDKPLTRIQQHRLEYLRRKLLGVDKDLALLRNQYKVACRHEVYKPKLGISYSRKDPDLALGLLSVTVVEANGLGTLDAPLDANKHPVRIIAHVREDRGDADETKEENPSISVGPPPQVSKPAKKAKRTT